jgi:hypothetical protein
LVATCYHHDEMKYCPVLVKIESSIIRDFHNGFEYLLQVWDNENEKIFGRPLKQKIRSWAIFFNYFIYKPDEQDENSDYIHLVDLERENSAVLFYDFTRDPDCKKTQYICKICSNNIDRYYAYHNEIFYVASSKDIKIFKYVGEFEKKGEIKINIKPEEIETISRDHLRDMKIHGIYMNHSTSKSLILALETVDNQVDFNQLIINSFNEASEGDEEKGFDFEFRQVREVVPRNTKYDEIKKFSISFTEKKDGSIDSFAIALRKSGSCDFYYCLAKVATYERIIDQNYYDEMEDGTESKRPKLDMTHPVMDVDCSFDMTYVLFGSEKDGTAIVKGIDHSLQSRVSPEEADTVEHYKFSNIFYQRVKN